MALILYYHPLASYCHKVLIALYEHATPFEARFVDLSNPDSSAEMLSLWPFGKFPVLRDEARQRTVPETSVIIEYLTQHYPGTVPLMPSDPELQLEARLWDRVFDLYVSGPMQSIVADRLRSEDQRDALGVAEAMQSLRQSYDVIEQRMKHRQWAVGDTFSLADCAAAPALFYASILLPFGESRSNLAAYFERLINRKSVARTLEEAQPYFHFFPYFADMPARFLSKAREE